MPANDSSARQEPDAVVLPGDTTPPGPEMPAGVICPECGYDLRGLTSARCPECGDDVTHLRSRRTQIPWSYRRGIGRMRAYWSTVWLVVRRPSRLASEINCDVSYRDAQRFRWVTLAHAYGTVVIGSAILCTVAVLSGSGFDETAGWAVGGVLISTLLFLALLPGVGSYFFQPRNLTVAQQNAAIALSYYAWAPLALLPITILPFAPLVALNQGPITSDAVAALLLITIFIPFIIALLCAFRWYRFNQVLLRKSRLASFGRLAALGGLSVVLALLVGLVPAVVFYVAVIICTLL